MHDEIPLFLDSFREWLDDHPCPNLIHTTFRFRHRRRGVRILSSVPDGLSVKLARLLAAVVKNQHRDTGEPLTWDRVAEHAGYKPKASIRNDLSDLCYRGLLISTPVGYRTPDWRAGHIEQTACHAS